MNATRDKTTRDRVEGFFERCIDWQESQGRGNGREVALVATPRALVRIGRLDANYSWELVESR